MNNAAASQGPKATVSTLIVCEPCYLAATVATPVPTNVQREAESAMAAKVGYYSHGANRFYSTRANEEATCQICWRGVDYYSVLWGSPDN